MPLPQLRRLRWAVRATLLLGVSASVVANVLHALDNPISEAIAAWPPLALLLTVELISRVPVGGRLLAVARVISTATIAGIAAWVSYWHMAGVAARYGETGASPYLLPLSVDGLIVVASICLVELGSQISAHTTAASREPTALTPPTPLQPGDDHPAPRLTQPASAHEALPGPSRETLPGPSPDAHYGPSYDAQYGSAADKPHISSLDGDSPHNGRYGSPRVPQHSSPHGSEQHSQYGSEPGSNYGSEQGSEQGSQHGSEQGSTYGSERGSQYSSPRFSQNGSPSSSRQAGPPAAVPELVPMPLSPMPAAVRPNFPAAPSATPVRANAPAAANGQAAAATTTSAGAAGTSSGAGATDRASNPTSAPDRASNPAGASGRTSTPADANGRGNTQAGPNDRGTTQAGATGRGSTQAGATGRGSTQAGANGRGNTPIRPLERAFAEAAASLPRTGGDTGLNPVVSRRARPAVSGTGRTPVTETVPTQRPAPDDRTGSRNLRRSPAETYALAQQIKAQQPGITEADLAAELGISPSRWRVIRRDAE